MEEAKYNLELSESEVKGLGEKRYTKPRANKLLIPMAIGGVLIVIAAIIVDHNKVIGYPLALIGLGILLYPFYVVMHKASKAGQQFLIAVKEGKQK